MFHHKPGAVVFYKYKPGASVRTHLIIAAAIWSIVGLLLLARGSAFLVTADRLWLLLPAILIGSCKSLLLLDKSARKNLDRLARKEDGSCIGGVYSPKMWILIIMMIFMGRFLRNSGMPEGLIGLIYAAIGWALFFSSRLLWNAVRQKIN